MGLQNAEPEVYYHNDKYTRTSLRHGAAGDHDMYVYAFCSYFCHIISETTIMSYIYIHAYYIVLRYTYL